MNGSKRMFTLVTEYIESLRKPQASPSDEAYEREHTGYERRMERADSEIAHLIEQVEEKAAEIQHVRDQLTEKDRQLANRDDQLESILRSLDQAQQLLAVQTKTSVSLTGRLQMIEDLRHRPW